MGKREDKRRAKMVDEVFKNVDQIEIQTSLGVIKLISLEEMPMGQMREFMMTPNDLKMLAMTEMIHMCLVNPEEWEGKLELLSVRDMNRLIKQWMQISGDMSLLSDESGDKDKDE